MLQSKSLQSLIAVCMLFASANMYAQAQQQKAVMKAPSKPEKAKEEKADVGKRAAPKMADQEKFFEPKSTKPIDAKADELRVKTIKSIVELLKTAKEDARRFELKRRLGEQYIERHDYLRAVELDRFAKQYDKWVKAGQKGKEPQADYSRSKKMLTTGVGVYQSLVKEYPKNMGIDLVIYELAKSMLLVDEDQGVAYLKKLTNEYPNSILVPDAYLGLGEYYFDKYKMPEAKEYYTKVLAFKTHKAYPYAVYKLGWTHYNLPTEEGSNNLAHLEKSIAAFKLVVKIADRQAKKGQKLLLREEAIKDLIMVFADTEDIEGAWAYFKQIDSTDSFYLMLERMGWIYTDQGKFDKAIAVYQRLLNEAPLRAGNAQIHAKLASLHFDRQQVKAVVTDLRTMTQLYLGKTKWTEANKADPEVITKASESVASTLHRLGTMYHDEGAKTKNKQTLTAASIIYSLYLKSFAKTELAYDLRYYLADVQFTLEMYDRAANNYTKVANAKPKDGKFLEDAALNAVICMNNVVNAKTFEKVPAAGKVPQPMAIPKEKKKLVLVSDNYIRLLPSKKDGHPMRASAAQVYFDYGHYKEALERLEKIIKVIPATEQSNASIKLILSYYADNKQWDKLIERGKEYMATKGLMDAKLTEFVQNLLVTASFERAMAFEQEKKFDQAADAFVAFQRDFPKEENADRALYNATVNYYKAGKVTEALNASKVILQKYPNFKLKSDVIVTMGETYEGLAQFSAAADYYKLLANTWPKDSRSPNALFNAAILYKGLKKPKDAHALLVEFLRRYPTHQLAGDASFEIPQLLEMSGAKAQARTAYFDYANRFGKDNADRAFFARAKAAEIAVADASTGDGRKEMQTLWVDLVRAKSVSAVEARRIVARSLFEYLRPDHDKFVKDFMPGGDQLQQQAEAKQKRLQRLAKNYEDIIALKNAEYAIASFYKLGEEHETFGDNLIKIKLPDGLNAEEQAQVRKSLSDAGGKLRDQAFKFYELAFKSSTEAEAFSPWTKASYEKLAMFNPQKYPRIDEQQVEPGYVVHSLQYDPSVAGVAK